MQAPCLRPDPPLLLLANRRSGAGDANELIDSVLPILAGAGRAVRLGDISPGRDGGTLRRWIEQARKDGALVVAVGGDGTVNRVAAQCLQDGIPCGVLPAGTFNYFARDIGIPLEPESAARVLLHGRLRAVGVGYVNGHPFLNNASFGRYTHVIRERERVKARFGRFRPVALLALLRTLFRGQKPFAIHVERDGEKRIYRSEMVFVGNNSMQLARLDPGLAQCAARDRLAVVVVKPTTRLKMAELLMHGLLKNLRSADRIEMFCAERMRIDSRRRDIDVVVDGELVRCDAPLEFHAARQALWVMTPGDA
ncbi:diacylglycerol kinase [Oxalobacteraceae bacterium OM1]|nr:diacylglycerol kinase [Oxalobacteraceae bacterium OM1]